jgi:scyllo-inositol 2-dehydrogenase (NADP+)
LLLDCATAYVRGTEYESGRGIDAGPERYPCTQLRFRIDRTCRACLGSMLYFLRRGDPMLRIGLIGLGKMGLSHFAILNSHPDVELVAVCDTSAYVLDVLAKYTGVKGYTDYARLLDAEKPDAVFIATPSRSHGHLVSAALDRDVHVFCEKPFCLDLEEGQRLMELAEGKCLVNQVGYHCRFIGSFEEVKHFVDAGVLGQIHHIRVEAYGPVVLRSKGNSWRSQKGQGGGCLYDYACHAIDLVHYIAGRPDLVRGTVMNQIFSSNVEDEVYSTFVYANGMTAQVAANWSDGSQRKMSTKLTIWGTNGKVEADRQELHAYLRNAPENFRHFNQGWNTRYTTELTEEVWFYLRGEEYSAQVDHFIKAIEKGRSPIRSSFRSALDTDKIAAMMIRDAHEVNAERPPIESDPDAGQARDGRTWRSLIGRLH